MDRLYFVVRTDLPEGRRTAMAIHAMDEWNAIHGPHQGTVIVYSVDTEQDLLDCFAQDDQAVLWREPDLANQAAAFVTNSGRKELALLGHTRARTRSVF